MSKVERKDCVETLSCALTEEQVAGYSQDMAGLHQTKLEVEDQKKEMTKDFGARIQKFESDIHVLSRKITTKKEARDVNCFWEFDYSKGEKTLFRTDTGEAVKVETISAIERQRYIEFVEKENKDGEISQAVKKAEEKNKKAPKSKVVEKTERDKSCPDCGAPEGEEHSEGCPTLMPEEGTEETEGSPGQEESGDDTPEVPEEEETPPKGPVQEEVVEVSDGVGEEDDGGDCFGTFDSNDAECANCNKKDDCYTETSRKRLEEAEGKEPAVEEQEEPKSEEEGAEVEAKPFYTCKQCGKGFNEYVDKGDGIWECPHCNSDSWM